MKRLRTLPLMLLFAATLVVAGCGNDAPPPDEDAAVMAGETMREQNQEMDGMGGMMGEGYVPDSLARMRLAPLVKAYYEGGEAFFIHTEVSDADIAGTLTEMMGPQVVTMPALAEVSPPLTAPIYVFASGIDGMGPMGYQPDVLPSVPGDEGYSPLRRIHLVRWSEGTTPRELTTAEAVQEAQREGEVTIEETGTVVNAPVLAWPGGHR